MKTGNILKWFAIAMIAILPFDSCKKTLLDDVNNNPNLPTAATPDALLPSAEGSLAFAQGGDASRFTAIFTQDVTGGSRQFFSYNRYIFSEEDFNNLWSLNLYAGPMEDLHDIITISQEKGYKTYEGVAKILMAYTLGLTTDMWGDVPYSEAFQGDKNLTPKFDSQQEIYTTLQQLLTEAKNDLQASDPGEKVPGGDDFIYGGDVSKWLQFDNALSARFYIHLTKVDPNAAQNAINALSAGAMTSNADDAQFLYGTSETFSNPWYQYIEQRDDILYEGFLIDTMTALNDPRVAVYTNMYDAGASKFAAINAPVPFLNYFEQKFIEAEADMRLNNVAAAQLAYTDAITASMNKMGVASSDITTYLAANGTLVGTPTQMLDQIMFQKYIAMYLQPESWTDWRRTDVPALIPNQGVISSIPRRFIYPTNERLYNPNCPQNSSLLTPRLWWDQ
ncbi:MAG TPA: SusD/RagB family nutrient-binding outer membrane lipoprotein [Bacteroidia bacterium]|nr:SusD/RagB family nutrient-binding outer membrane lipoprotein [Bacteroidia bacterium]